MPQHSPQPRAARHRLTLAALISLGVLLVAVMVWLGTGTSGSASPTQDARTVSGLLIDVVGPADGSASRIRVRDADGTEWTFGVAETVLTDPEHPVSVKHLHLHLSSRQPVKVSYRDSAAGPIAYRITDP